MAATTKRTTSAKKTKSAVTEPEVEVKVKVEAEAGEVVTEVEAKSEPEIETKVEESKPEVKKVEELKSATSREKVKTFNRDDEIQCKSCTIGGLWLQGIKTQRTYRWVSYGDIEYVEYQDLVPMISNDRSSYIYGPLFIIEDEDFINEFPKLKKFYEDKYAIKDLYEILRLDTDAMIHQIKGLPKLAFENIKRLVSTQVSDGTLDSVSKIKALDSIFGTDFSLVQSVIK